MADVRPLGPLTHISAEAIGQPGQRRFRLRAMNEPGETATLWLEKEQLTALGEALGNVLKAEAYEHHRVPLDDTQEAPVLPLNSTFEFQPGQLSLGLDHDERTIVLMAADGPAEDEATTSISMTVDYGRAYALGQQIASVVAAGRPPCPLCTAPMDPTGHVCVRTNGHNPH